MKRVAVFGNAGGGKSQLSRQLADLTGLPLHILDKVQFQAGGVPVSPEEYRQAHAAIVAQDTWVIDGFGSLETLWPRLEAADTLVYIDLPLARHFAWVTKRLVMGYFTPPPGWPENTPLLKSSLTSYQVLWLCHQKLTPKYREYVAKASATKQVYHLRSAQQIRDFLATLQTAETPFQT
ncbi:adenylate kinase [filamentous cyanobacterium LEGE 11480]|uniref:Adenylate kinase n=1 Tax=Romeriopsis navalis LEGE 11480 TaxID=2777977 RepID=A0A928VP91_9CYAN|nr:adenylate kinase [Romeriopsis navalis]MBE9030356.1 adenylate kinase [Romeriopsis navalis LEGE 11480]